MLLIDDLLLAPIKGVMWICKEILEAAEQDRAAEGDRIKDRLRELYMLLETQQITEQAFDDEERVLLDRLDELEAAGAAGTEESADADAADGEGEGDEYGEYEDEDGDELQADGEEEEEEELSEDQESAEYVEETPEEYGQSAGPRAGARSAADSYSTAVSLLKATTAPGAGRPQAGGSDDDTDS